MANQAGKLYCGSEWSGPSLMLPHLVRAMPTMNTRKNATDSM